MYGVTNQDTFRYSSLVNGTERLRLGMMITTLLLPGIPSLLYGDEQSFYYHDSRSENYIYGRQPMTSASAWQTHGCYRGRATYQFIDMPFSNQSRNGCLDDSQSLDHFDQTSMQFLFTQTLYAVRLLYPVFSNGFSSDIMKRLYFPDTSSIWSITRSYFPAQNITLGPQSQIWIIYSNSSTSTTFTGGCDETGKKFFSAPFADGGLFTDVFPPYGQIQTQQTASGAQCLDTLTLPMFGYRVLVAAAYFTPMAQLVVRISPSHDSRILRNRTNMAVPVTILFSDTVNCADVIRFVSVISFSGITPIFDLTSIICKTMSDGQTVYGMPQAVYQWSASLLSVPDGIIQIDISDNLPTAKSSKLLVQLF